jgi:hypothetical protein
MVLTRVIDLVDHKFGKLTVIKLDHVDVKKGAFWECLCDCGKTKIVSAHQLKSGSTSSCGCLRRVDRKGNLVGLRFGRLVVISLDYKLKVGRRVSTIFWNCKCDCGNMVKVSSYDLQMGVIKSCGIEKDKLSIEFSLEDQTSSDVALQTLYDRYKYSAKYRELDFNLTIGEFNNITKQDCYYCGVSPWRKVFGSKCMDYTYNGIDRVDSYKGYTVDNCVPCCRDCNVAKLDRTKENFYEWVDTIYNHIHTKQETSNESLFDCVQ